MFCLCFCQVFFGFLWWKKAADKCNDVNNQDKQNKYFIESKIKKFTALPRRLVFER
jgi:hypothetical protein